MAETMDEPTPNRAAIHADLTYFYSRFATLGVPCWFELRAFNRQGVPLTAKFRPDAEGIDLAADWAAEMNKYLRSVYGVRNAIRDGVAGSATDADIEAAFFLWADADDDGATENVKRFDGPKPNIVLKTGRVPGERIHTYWELDEPCLNLGAWRERQQAIAAHFSSDVRVVNPSRIMRIAGTVTYPDPKKRAKGYVSEIVAMKAFDRDPLEFERALRVWPAARAQAPQAAGDGFAVDTGPVALDRERARIQALGGEEWHHSVIRLVASYVAKGLSDAEIHGLTDPLTLTGYTVEQTRREVQTAIDGARRKGWTPETPQPRTNFDHPPSPDPADAFEDAPDAKPKTWRVQTLVEFTADFVAPEWIVDGVIQRGRLYTCTAPTGHAKTAFWLYASAQIGAGRQVCGKEVEQGDVIYMAGENPDDVRARTIAAGEKYGLDPAACRLHFIPGTFSIRQDMERLRAAVAALPSVVLIVVDTLAAYFDGDDDNSNAQMLDFARVVRALTETASRPAVVMPAHPVKRAPKGDLTPRGGGAMLNEVDGNFTIWKDEAVATLHWQGKIRGPDFEPIKVEIATVEHDRVRDRKGRLMPTVIATPVLEMRAEALAREAMSREDTVLMSIADAPGMSARERVAACRLPSTGALSRTLDKLAAAKLIRKAGRKWALTGIGEETVEDIQAGRQGSEPLGE